MNHKVGEEPIIQTVAEPLHQMLRDAAAQRGDEPAKGIASNQALPYRPANRQPVAALTVLDDGSLDQGEMIRIRDQSFTIGRERGDLKLPFDNDISGLHAELRCQHQNGRCRWFLLDRKSTNGTFVRTYRASLYRDTELIVGGRRYLFQLPQPGNAAIETDALQTQAYRAPAGTLVEQFVPKLIETGVTGEAPRSFPIGGQELFLGSDSQCQIVIANDPFLNSRHARIYKDESDRWMIDDQKSLNGIWIRIKKLALDRQAEFQCGQQRFRFQPTLS